MADFSEFESRTGRITCTKEDVFSFVTDLQNFSRFVKPGTISKWHADTETCTFEVGPIGSVNIRILEKEPFSKVLFSGDALRKNEFLITLHINDDRNDKVSVKVDLKAELNPVMKMVAARPIEQFLEKLMDGIENFDGWKDK